MLVRLDSRVGLEIQMIPSIKVQVKDMSVSGSISHILYWSFSYKANWRRYSCLHTVLEQTSFENISGEPNKHFLQHNVKGSKSINVSVDRNPRKPIIVSRVGVIKIVPSRFLAITI